MADTNVQADPVETLNIIGGIISIFDRPQRVKDVKQEESPVQRFMAEKENMPVSRNGNDDYEPDAGNDDYDLD